MKPFAHFNASNFEEAAAIMERYRGKAALIAGGTDLLGKLKDCILPGYPEAVVNLKDIPGADRIAANDAEIEIGSLALLEDIAHNQDVRVNFPALAQAAPRTASPHLREMGTIGGNICQDIRCWYYRHPENRFPCLRKGGGKCYAIAGDSRYHSIFGASVEDGCLAVHPSDTAPALAALDAAVVTTKRTMPVEDFFQVSVSKTTVLDDAEIVEKILIPKPQPGAKSAFKKYAQRKSIDFPIVNCAAMVWQQDGRVKDARICLNAVWVKPYRPLEAEEILKGKQLDHETAQKAGETAVQKAMPLNDNGYMVQAAKVLVRETLLACQ